MRELALSSAGETRREPAEHRGPRAGGAVGRRRDAESTVVLHCQVNNFVLYFFSLYFLLQSLPPEVSRLYQCFKLLVLFSAEKIFGVVCQ